MTTLVDALRAISGAPICSASALAQRFSDVGICTKSIPIMHSGD